MINTHYDDCYFSVDSGFCESMYVFIEGNFLGCRLHNGFNIGETGFGTGLNLLVLEEYLLTLKKRDFEITFTSVEKYILRPEIVNEVLSELKEVTTGALYRHIELYNSLYSGIKTGWNTIFLKRKWGSLKLNLYVGEVLDSFDNYPLVIDAWFLDGHSPDKNPEMWSQELFQNIAKVSGDGTTFATYTAAGVVKQGLRNAGFIVKRKKGYGKKRHMIIGSI